MKYTIDYKGDLRCLLTHQDSGVTMLTDAPKDNQGKGESFSPTDLFALSLGSCMMTIMGIQARALGIELTGTRIEVEKVMSATPPRKIKEVHVTFFLPAVEEKRHAQLIRAAESCPVHHSLHPDTVVSVKYFWGQKA